MVEFHYIYVHTFSGCIMSFTLYTVDFHSFLAREKYT